MKHRTHLVHAIFLACFLALPSWAGGQGQTMPGRVVDKDTRQPLTGATVLLPDIETMLGTVTEYDGTFVLAYDATLGWTYPWRNLSALRLAGMSMSLRSSCEFRALAMTAARNS